MPEKLERCVQSVMNQADMKRRYPNLKERRSRAFAICNAATKKGGVMEEYGYFVQLDEGSATKPVQALKLGKYKHPVYGDIEITEERLQRFADNVNNKVRGIDPDIDYAHKTADSKAAGWVKSAEVKDGSLMLSVEWTPAAEKAIKDKEYRYFSADFYDEWQDAEGAKHKDVLAGGAITNRPFLKDLSPINFEEFGSKIGTTSYLFEDDDRVYKAVLSDKADGENHIYFYERKELEEPRKEGELEAKKLAEALGISSEKEDDLLGAVKSLVEFKNTANADAEKAKKFSEDYPEMARKMEEDAKRLTELENSKKLMETDSRIKDWSHGKNSIPPVLHDQVRDFRMNLDVDGAQKFDEIIAKVHEVGLVTLDEEIGGDSNPTEQDSATQFEAKIAELQDKDKDLDYFEAVKLAEEQNPDLAKAYKAANR